ncbi:MAG: conjugal transfer protein TraD [Alphaproteobacteria bacterium]|nr:conjugal transfer protein TraD [Alphaproteobacteria bacterium]
MPKLTLGERLEKAAARKARAEQEAARLKLMQRKERTRHLIEVGGLLVKAGIDALPPAALYDRFLHIAAEAKDDPKAVGTWERAGSKHFQQEADTRVVAIARFGTKIDPELTATLRSLGFRYNRFLKQWEGKVDFANAKETVEGMGGSIKLVGEKEHQ